jgi:riboflavin kinase/FMN adenylyltransferase
MAVFYNIHGLPEFKDAVLTTGTFDGVHKGHLAILEEVVDHARKVGGTSVLLTFEPHPRKLLFPDQPLGIITPLHQKINLLSEAGIEHIVVVPFTKEFSALSASEYLSDFIVRLFHPHSIVLGYDHHFGNDRKGNIDLLKTCAEKNHYELIEIPAQLIDEAAVSSTKIRHAIMEGRMEDAAKMLGRYYTLGGLVIHGNKLGRTIGYPTANLQPEDADQILPAIGVYAIRATYNGISYDGMLSIGYNPTVTDKKELRIEANLFDFDLDIYGQRLDIVFIEKLRNEQKFASLEELILQLHRDKEDTMRLLAR